MRTPPLVLVLLVAAFVFGCDDNPVDDGSKTPQDPAKADQVATKGFQALGDSIQALEDRDSGGLRDVRFDDIRSQLEKALTYESNNGIAHLGLAIVEILELNYSSDIWEVVDSLDAWGGSAHDIVPPWPVAPSAGQQMLIGRQFELMARLPIATSMRMAMTFPANVSVQRIQEIITNTVRPALNRSIGHLNIVEGQTDSELRIHIKDNGVEEDIVVDLGEILVFSAAVHALRGGFSTVTAYDVDMWGPDGTYDWLDDIRDLSPSGYCSLMPTVEETDAGGGWVNLAFTTELNHSSSLTDSIWLDVARYNLEDRDAFLSLRDNGAALSSAHTDLLGVVNRLEDAVAFIRSRPNETEENVIKLADLTDLDSDLGDPSGPNFAKNWTKVEDVIAFARDLLSGPVSFNEELGPNHTPFTWTSDLSVFFNSPVDDWNELLPYHRWDVPVGAWLTSSVDSLETYYWGGEYESFVQVGPGSCTYRVWPQVSNVSFSTTRWHIDSGSFLELLDGSNGNPIDLDVARFPYFPDYTFNGLFPGMGRAKWLQLIDILDPPPGAYLAQGRGVLR